MSGYNADRTAGRDDDEPVDDRLTTANRVQMVIYVSPIMKRQVKGRAGHAGVTMSEWVEALIRKEFEGEDDVA